MAATVIRNFIAKALFKKKGAIANSKAVDFSANALEQRLKNIGVDPNAITSENELNQILSYVKQAEDQAFNQSFGNMLGGSKFDRKGEVFDMTGKKLDSSRGTIGGTQIDENTLKQGLMKTDNPFSDLVKTTDQGPKTLAEREAEVLARLEKENKEAAQRIRDRKKLDDPEDMATGGRVGLLAGSVPKVFKFLKNKKKINEAVNNIFPTGDYKYDAQLAADSLVENNPQIFGGKLYEDLDIDTQMEVYGAVIGPIQNSALSVSRMKKATKPEKTLQSMKEGKGINMSDPEIAEEFSRFMKETDPEGTKKLKQTLELDTFDPTGRKKNADGGRIGLRSGLSKAFLEFLKKFKVKQSGDDLKDFLSKRQFMKDMVGNTKANERARELTMLKENLDNYRKRYKGYEFPSDEQIRIDLEKRIQPILNKGRKLNSDGGRIGYADGTPSFEDYLKERGMIEKRQNLEQLMKDYQEDMRRKKVMEQKQMVADGGRIGLKAGMTKRAFLKLMGGVGATIGAAKSGIFTGLGKGAGKQVAKEVVEQGVRSAPPPYFFELANKIKMLGKPDKVTYADRVEIHRYRGKNGDEYELIEDLNTGDVRITKDKTGIGSLGDKTFDTIEDRTILEYKKGDADVDPESGTAFKSADEYEEYKVEFDADGTPADATDLDAVVQKEIIEEATGDAPSIKKAGGGIARMLGE